MNKYRDMKRIKKVSFNTVQFVKRFDKTLPSNQLSNTLTEPIMSIMKSPTSSPPPPLPPSPVSKITNEIKDMAIVVKKSPPPLTTKTKSLDNDAGSHKKSKTKSPPPKSKTKSPPPKSKTKSPTKASPQPSKKSPIVSKKSKATSKKSPTKSKSS